MKPGADAQAREVKKDSYYEAISHGCRRSFLLYRSKDIVTNHAPFGKEMGVASERSRDPGILDAFGIKTLHAISSKASTISCIHGGRDWDLQKF